MWERQVNLLSLNLSPFSPFQFCFFEVKTAYSIHVSTGWQVHPSAERVLTRLELCHSIDRKTVRKTRQGSKPDCQGFFQASLIFASKAGPYTSGWERHCRLLSRSLRWPRKRLPLSQSYQTFFSASLMLRINKLECFWLSDTSILV